MKYNYFKDLDTTLKILSLFKNQGLDYSSIKNFIDSFDKKFLKEILEQNKITGFANNLLTLNDGSSFRAYNFQDRKQMSHGIIIEKLASDDVNLAAFEHLQIWPFEEQKLKMISSLDYSLIRYGEGNCKNRKYETFYISLKDNLLKLKKVINTTKNNFKIEFEGNIELKEINEIK